MSWVGGDIAGIQSMGASITPVAAELRGAVHALTSGAEQLVGDAGWSGDAASAFRLRWSENSIQAGALADVVEQVGTTMTTLGDALARAEADLYNAASDAAARGAQIDAEGRPALLVVTGDPAAPAVVAAQAAQADYAATYQATLALAQGFRLTAADSLAAVGAQIEPGPETERGLTPDQSTTVADFLKALYVVPGARAGAAAGTLPQEVTDAARSLDNANALLGYERQKLLQAGAPVPADLAERVGQTAAVRDLEALQARLVEATKGRFSLPLTSALNTSLADAEKLLPSFRGAVPAELAFLKDVPVIDVAATVAVAGLQADDDHQKGWPGPVAVVKDVGAGLVGLAGGLAVTNALTAAESSPSGWAVTLGAAATVLEADAMYQGLHEHWKEDVHDKGVVGGVTAGAASVATNTGKDVVAMATGAWSAVSGLFP